MSRWGSPAPLAPLLVVRCPLPTETAARSNVPRLTVATGPELPQPLRFERSFIAFAEED